MGLSNSELERRCQKLDHRRLGNWMARRISRPMALHVTRVVVPLGISAHVVTLTAWGVGCAAAGALAWGTLWGWLIGAILLQLWYLLDHVDGQVARFHGTASLDGVQLDYLMHHSMNLAVPIGIGWGLAVREIEPLWLAGGLAWGAALLMLGLIHDSRYKAFVQRLKLVHGPLEVIGGGGGRPTPAAGPPRGWSARAAWLARKACEMHVIMNTVAAIAVAQWLLDDRTLVVARLYLMLMAPMTIAVAAATLWRSIHREQAEHEFAAWYRPAAGHVLACKDGWWHVERAEDGMAGR